MGIIVLEAALFPNTLRLVSSTSTTTGRHHFTTNPQQLRVPLHRAPVVAGVFVATDLVLALSAPQSGISHAAHLGGALTGLLYALCLRRFGCR
jgi:membrane associated rhomboid family serine protease